MKNSKKLLSVLLTMIMTFSLMFVGLTTAFAITSGDPATTTITASPTSIPANGTSTSTITVQVKDSGGANVPTGTDAVILSADSGSVGTVTDNTDGTYTATYTSSTTSGTVIISGTLNGTAITSTTTINLLSGANAITAFSFDGLAPAVTGTITGADIALTVPNGTDVTALVATFTNSAASVVTVSATTQTSGTTANDFTAPVVYTVTAEDGTSVTYTVTVTVAPDTTAPDAPIITTASQSVNASTITVIGTAEAGSTVNITGGSAPASGTATGGAYSIVVTLTANTINTLSVTATDAVGNVSSAATVAINQDSIAPVVTGVIEGGFYQTASPTFTEGTATLTTGVGTPGAYTTNTPIAGDSAQVLVVTDAAGNVTTVNFTTDNTAPTAPIVNIIDSALYDANGVTPNISFAPADATQTITLDGAAYTSGAITTDGAHLLVITNTDTAGNTSSITVNFTVDAVVPTITLVGSSTITVDQGSTYTDAGATASNNLDGDITASIITSGTVNTTTVGSYTITYNVSDAAGNPAVAVTRTVDVTIPATPAAPSVTNDDTANTVTGMASGMEYNLDDAGYVLYDTVTFNAIDLSGVHTLLVRIAAEGYTPAGLETTLTFIATPGEDKKVTSITGNNILLVGDYAFDLSDSANNNYNLNNFLVAANTAYLNAGTYEVYFRIGDKWYDIVSNPTMATSISSSTINVDGLFNYMNMQ